MDVPVSPPDETPAITVLRRDVVPPWRILWPLFVIPAGLALVLIGAYCWQFSGGISNRQEHWGTFGDFLGGVLNPVTAWITLVTIAISLRYNAKALSVSAEAVDATRGQLEAALLQLQLERDRFDHDRKEERSGRARERQVQREERTLLMNQVWNNPEMQRVRAEAMQWLLVAAHIVDPEGPLFSVTGETVLGQRIATNTNSSSKSGSISRT
jgi:hypothetical protein